MFYSTNEISIMSKSHGDDIRRCCESCRKRGLKKRDSGSRISRLIVAITTIIAVR